MSTHVLPIARFRCGRLVTTRSALSRLSEADILEGIGRHQAGDWGHVDKEDREANERALIERTRLFSVYHAKDGVTFWIITEADRSSTTVLLLEDY
jgi:hypothetical protein